MKKYDQIHETVLRTAIDLLLDIKDLATKPDKLADVNKMRVGTGSNRDSRGYIKSIARGSNDLICAFPVLSSRNININTQAMVSKAIEKNCVSMLQMLFAAYQIQDSGNLQEYLSNFHTNINKNASAFGIDDVLQLMGGNFAPDIAKLTGKDITEGSKIAPADRVAIKEDMKFIDTYLKDNVNPHSISESFSCKMDNRGVYQITPKHVSIREGAEKDDEMTRLLSQIDDISIEISDTRELLDKLTSAGDQALRYQKRIAELEKEKIEAEKKLNKVKQSKDSADFFKSQVLPSEYKKANELMPTTMAINFKVVNSNGAVTTVDNAVIGVKAKLYPISSEDMISHVASRAKDANWMTKLMKLSTGEISFFRDFLFAIDKCKVDAMAFSTKSSDSTMWQVLRRRANRSKWNQLWNRRNDATAITTLMMSQNEVDYIKKEYGIDVDSVRVARDLLNHYNLLGICIVDESLEIAKFMFDTGEDLWETIPFSSLEREASDATYKKVVNLMTKVM